MGQKSTPGSVDSSGPAREGRSPNGSSARRQSRRYRVSGARTARQQQRCAGPYCGSLAQKKRLPRLTVAAFTKLILTDQHQASVAGFLSAAGSLTGQPLHAAGQLCRFFPMGNVHDQSGRKLRSLYRLGAADPASGSDHMDAGRRTRAPAASAVR